MPCHIFIHQIWLIRLAERFVLVQPGNGITPLFLVQTNQPLNLFQLGQGTLTLKIFTSAKKILGMVILLAAIALVCPGASLAGKARITDFVVTNTRDDLLVYLTVKGCFTKEMEEAILSGIPTTFSIFISLSRVRNFWYDKEIAEITITHTIRYDTLKKEFSVIRSKDPERPLVTRDFSEAKKNMAEVDSLEIVSLSKLEKGSPYQIQAKAELDRVTLPLYLHHVLFFVSFWDFETDWHTINFYY